MNRIKLLLGTLLAIFLTNGLMFGQDTTLTVTSNGNVGIGITDPTQKLVVDGFLRVVGSNRLMLGGPFSAEYLYNPNGTSLRIHVGNDDRITIGNGGNVGIGTTSPASRLDVIANGATKIDLRTSSTTEPIFQRFFHSTNIQGGAVGFDTDDNVLKLLHGGNFNTSTKGLMITSDGNVGIGTTSPTAKLHIGGTAGVDGIKFPDGTLQTTAATGGSGLWSASGSDIFYNSGKVGIGTGKPSSQLEVVSPSTSTITATSHNSVAQFIGRAASGNPTAPTAVGNGLGLAWFGAQGYTGSEFSPSRAAMIMNASENWSSSAHGAEIAFGTTENGTTSRVERMRIDNQGRVGIGTTSPGADLEVAHPFGSRIRASTHKGSGGFIGRSAQGSLGAEEATISGSLLSFFGAEGHTGSNFTSPRSYIGFFATEDWSPSTTGTEMRIITNPNGGVNLINAMRIAHNGNVGIGTPATPIHPLEMASGAHVTAGGVWTNASSRTLKNDISELKADDALSALAKLNPVRFKYKSQPGEEYLGFIAEDVPDVVATQDRKSLSPMDIVAVLTKVVQQQQQKIAELEARLNASQ